MKAGFQGPFDPPPPFTRQMTSFLLHNLMYCARIWVAPSALPLGCVNTESITYPLAYTILLFQRPRLRRPPRKRRVKWRSQHKQSQRGISTSPKSTRKTALQIKRVAVDLHTHTHTKHGFSHVNAAPTKSNQIFDTCLEHGFFFMPFHLLHSILLYSWL